MFALLFLLATSQDSETAATLLKGGWAAVDELGAKPEFRDRLSKLAAAKDPELAWWAGAALADLEAREQAGESWPAPLRVTLSAKERPASEVLRELLTLGRGSPPVLELNDDDPSVTVSFKDAPYLQAFDDVCNQAGFVLARGQGGKFHVGRMEPARGPRFYRAGFAASVHQVVRRTDVTFREEPASALTMFLFVRADPRQRMQESEPEGALVRVEDDTGRSLLKDGSKPAFRVRVADASAMAQLTLQVPSPEAKKISVLRGTVVLTVAKKVEDFVFEEILKKPEQERESGGVKAALRKVEKSGDEVKFEVELTAASALPWPDTEALVLDDGEGRPFQRWGSSMSSSGGSATYRMTYRDRDGLGTPKRLRFSVATQSYPRRVPFELKDLVLR